MKKTILAAAAAVLGAVCSLGAFAQAPTGYVTVSASNMVDSTGTKVASATISFAPVNNAGQAISFKAGGANGQVTYRPVTTTVTNGAFSVVLADTSLTNPANVCYSVTMTDNVSGKSLLGTGYSCMQPASTGETYWCTTGGGSTSCNFDEFIPAGVAGALVTAGPAGPAGAAGAAGAGFIAGLASDGANGISVQGSVSAALVKGRGTGSFAYSGLSAFGDSITVGNGASVLSNGYANLLIPQFGGGTNYGFAGDYATDMSYRILHNMAPPNYYAQPAWSAMIGMNESHTLGTGSVASGNYQLAATAAYAYAATPQQFQIYFGTNTVSASTPTGTWTQDSMLQTNLGLSTQSTSATLTFNTFLPSKYLVIAWEGQNSNTSSAALSCDSGAVTDTLNTEGTGSSISFNSETVTAFGKIETFASATTHSCTLTVTASSGNPFVALFAATPPPQTFNIYGSQTASGPEGFVLGVTYENADADSTATAFYNSLSQTVATNLNSAGWTNVNWVNVRNYVNSTSDTSGTAATLANGITIPGSTQVGEHPNDAGHRHIADAVLAAAEPLGSLVLNSTAARTALPTYSTPNATAITSLLNMDGQAILPTTSDFGHGFLLGTRYQSGVYYDYAVAHTQNSLVGSNYGTEIIGPNNSVLSFCTYVPSASHPTPASITYCPFWVNANGSMGMGTSTSYANIGAYPNFNQANLAATNTPVAGILLYCHSGACWGFQQGYHSTYGPEIFSTQGHPITFGFAAGGTPTSLSSYVPSLWMDYNYAYWTVPVALSEQSSIASASTIAPTAQTFHITGTTTISTITPPTACTKTGTMCPIYMVSDSGAPFATGGNIVSALTPSSGTVVLGVYDPSISQWTLMGQSAAGTGTMTDGSGSTTPGEFLETSSTAHTYVVKTAAQALTDLGFTPPSVPQFGPSFSGAAGNPFTSNSTTFYAFNIPYSITFTNLRYRLTTADNTANNYDVGIYSISGTTATLVGHLGATAGTTFSPSTGVKAISFPSTTLTAGTYLFAITTNCASSCAVMAGVAAGRFSVYTNATGSLTTSGGVLNSSITGLSSASANDSGSFTGFDVF